MDPELERLELSKSDPDFDKDAFKPKVSVSAQAKATFGYCMGSKW